jgi:type II secretory pathway pseudopilin PulG
MKLRALNNQDGIALGPILFIIAILAILAAAIAAGSGSFTANTNNESAKTLAGAIIQQMDSVQNGIDYVLSNGCDPTQISFASGLGSGYTNPNAPSDGSCNVFDPRGGGIVYTPPPAAALDTTQSAQVGYGQYLFTGMLSVANLGNWMTNSDLIMSAPYLRSDVANQINALSGISGSIADNQVCNWAYTAPGLFTGSYGVDSCGSTSTFGLTSGIPNNVAGQRGGCIQRTDLVQPYECFHVLIVQ